MLTVSSIKGLKPKEKPYYEWDSNGQRGRGKLGVQVTPRGAKRFVFRYFVARKSHFIALGQFPEISLVEAREKQNKFGELLLQGIDPKEYVEQQERLIENAQREEARKGSLKQLFDAYVAQMKKDGKRTYNAVIKALEKEVYPVIDPSTKAKDVTTHDVILVLAGMIKRESATQSNRVRSYIMAAFNYGLKHDNDPANYIDEAKFGLVLNPVSAIPKQKSAEKVGEHYLSYTEIFHVFEDISSEYLRFQMGKQMRHLLALCFHTGGQRPYELGASKWEDVDWTQKTLTVAPDISKNKHHHIIPLTESAIAVLNSQRELGLDSEFIFPNRDDMARFMPLTSFSKAINRYCERTPEIRKFIPRDIRRTCKTLMGELGISKTLRDRLQNHALNDVSSKHYDRYEYLPEKRRALEAWEQRLNRTGNDNNVVTFAGRR